MNNKKLPWQVFILALAGASLPTACDNSEPRKTSFEEPFGFSEVRQLVAPIATMKNPADPIEIASLVQHGAHISKLYNDALTRFESIYGDGVGPARGSAEFLGCKATFHQVSGQIAHQPIADTELGIKATWAALKHCHEVAQGWAGPAEMATFGNDLEAMTEGSMLVFSYAAVTSKISSGQEYYREAAAFKNLDDPAA